jgi:hypothetical protein
MRRRRAAEALAAGIAYAAGLCWAGVCLVAAFRPGDLSAPYWRAVPGLRTDTCGIAAFFAVAVGLGTSEYFRLRRRRDAAQLGDCGPVRGNAGLMALATFETVAALATGLVLYLSVNAVTHPATLDLQATHLAAWPTEGTLRVIALLCCLGSVAGLRYLFTVPGGQQRPPGDGMTCAKTIDSSDTVH